MECALLPSGLEHYVPDSELSFAMVTEMSQPELPFADAVHISSMPASVVPALHNCLKLSITATLGTAICVT